MSSRIKGIIDAVADIAAQPGDGLLDKIKAYHGSPHDFDQFSFDNIGSGEGAQAYGHGLYFAEREGTAQSYRDALSGKYPSPRYKGKDINETDGPTSGALSLINKELLYNRGLTAKQAKEQAITSLNVRKKRAGVGVDSLRENQIISDIDEKIRLLESMDDSDLVVGGRMYEVDINASPDELLDYDVDLIDQSQKVKDGILKLGLTDFDGKKYSIQELDDLGHRGQTLYEKISGNAGDDVASMRLKDVGIKGIKYADAQTRFSPKGRTNNYVIFDDQLIDIAKKYGVSLPVAAAMFGSEETEAGPLTSGARRLIDARFSSPVGGGNERKGVLNAVETMQTGITPRNMDTGGEVNLYDFEGSPYILTQSDRSAAGGLLNSIHDADIDAVDLRGGRDFMFDPSSQGQVWASDPNVVKSLQKRAAQLKSDYGSDPLLLPYTMAPTGIDFATMPLDTMINFARQGMSKSNIKKLDKQIKGVIPQWTSVSDPSANAIFREVKGPSRKKVADLIDKNFRDVKGGLSISEARAATTDASQYVEKEGALKNIGRIDTSAGLIADSGHPTYIGGLPGEGVGTLKDALNARVLMEQNGRVLANDMSDIRALSMNHGLSQGIIDDSLLRRIYDNKDKVAVGGLGVAGPSLANASTDNAEKGLLGSIGDAGLEAMSGVNRAVVDGLNFLTADQINALLNISGSEKRIPDLYDLEGVEEATQGNYMEPGLLRDIIRQGSEFLSPI
jgi:hypothetical protein